MSTNDIPVSTIKQQALTDTPTTGDNTLFDDPVALFDDPTALFGGPNTVTGNIRTTVKPTELFTKIPRSS